MLHFKPTDWIYKYPTSGRAYFAKLENSVADNIESILNKDEVARHVAQQYISSIGG